MRMHVGLAALAVAALLAACQELPVLSLDDAELGLSKSSVFDTPAPDVVTYKGGDPGANERLERSYDTAPPMITHSIQDMTPIRQDFNLCKDCHVQPDLIGQPLDKGMPVPAPVSHYVENTKDLYMGRWNCTQCHRPQADVPPLVESTFVKDK